MSLPVLILFEDPHLLVVHKPSGLLSVPTPGAEGPTVLDAMREQGREVLPVHRLDREVSGVMLLARDATTLSALEVLFRERALRKLYWALALNGPDRDEGAITFPILEEGAHARVSALGKPSRTLYRVNARGPDVAEVEVELVTGRYNQIRLHFAHSGWPLVGDRKYGKFREDPFRFQRVALHAHALELPHPITGEPLVVEAPLPPDLVELREVALARGRRTRRADPDRRNSQRRPPRRD
ncbi:MAG: RluA family pseudouridine synthase [Planctomycetota bacterium]|nr:RluA family pseudouridine synthase [Planctomycetota bacterium]